MAQVVPTRLDTIITHLQTRLVNFLGWPAERVLVVDPDYMPYDSVADQYLMIFPEHDSLIGDIFDGAGRIDSRVSERIAITLRTRLSFDMATSNQSWLTDASLGHLLARHNILDALTCYQVVDNDDDSGNSGNWLLAQPMRLVGCGKPIKPKIGMPTTAPGWGESRIVFEIVYVLNLSQGYQ